MNYLLDTYHHFKLKLQRLRRKTYKGVPVLLIIVLSFTFLTAGGYAAINTYRDDNTSVNLKEGLVGQWDFEGDAKDSSTYTNHGSLSGVIGESGEITINRSLEWTTVNLNNQYQSKPVIVATPVTENTSVAQGSDGYYPIPLVDNVGTSGFDFSMCVDGGSSSCWQDNGGEPAETFHWFAFDVDKTENYDWIEVGTTDDVDVGGTDTLVNLSSAFSTTPNVWTQAQTYSQNGNIGAVSWVQDDTKTTTKFYYVGCAHTGAGDTCDTAAENESFGYVAIDTNNAASFESGVNFQSNFADITDSTWTAASFSPSYTDARVMVTQNDDDGGEDPQYAWVRDVTTSGMDFRYCEAESTTCDVHTSEKVYWFAVEDGSILADAPPTLTTGHDSQSNSAYDFDGTDDYITMGDKNDQTGSFTISAWINPDDISTSGQRIVVKDEGSGSGWALSLGDAGSGTLRFYMRNASPLLTDTGAILSAGNWYHIVAIYDATANTKEIFVDTISEASDGSVTGGPVDNTADFAIGGHVDSSRFFDGKIDNVRVYNRAINSSEITALYNENGVDTPIQVASTQGGLLSHWKMDDSSTSTVLDSTPHSNHGNEAVYGIIPGLEYTNMVVVPQQWNGSFNDGEFDFECPPDGNCRYATTDYSRYLGGGSSMNYGVGCQDANTGTGYIMASYENVHTRFSSNPPNANNADYFICVRYSQGVWQYDTNTAWVNFTPVDTDALFASVDFTNDTAQTLDFIPIGTTDRNSNTDQAYRFDGNHYIDAGDIDSPNQNSQVSISGWVYWDTLSGHRAIFTDGGSGRGIEFGLYNNELHLAVENNDSHRSLGYSTSNLSTGQWYHVVGVADGQNGDMFIYVNGNLVTSDTSLTAFTDFNGTNGTTIGNAGTQSPSSNESIGSYSYFHDGKIDDLRVYNRTLTTDEISRLYEEYNPGVQVSNLQKGLLGHYRLDESQATLDASGDVIDRTPYSNHGTAKEAPTSTTDRNGFSSSAISFDGIDSHIIVESNNFDSADVSFSFWVKTNGTSGFLMNKFLNTGYGWGVTTSGTTISIYEDINGGDVSNYSGAIGSGWHHVVALMDNLEQKLYIDGQLVGSGSNSDEEFDVFSGALYLGQRGNSSNYFNGELDDVRVYNRALSETEINALYESYD